MRKLIGTIALAAVVAGAMAGTAGAAKPPWAGGGAKPAVSKMKFKIVDHGIAEGESVQGRVVLVTGRGNQREPLAGAELTVLVDKAEVATVTTGADGVAEILYAGATAGEHVMRVVYAGDDAHRRAKRAQGFEVGGAGDEMGELPE